MNYNEWKRDNPKGTPRQYVEYCRKNGLRPNLGGADMTGADLRVADLRGADMTGADLRWADLSEADLSGANLRWANLSGADLAEANLRWADLGGANLRWADLRVVDLGGAHGPFTVGYFGRHHAIAAGGYISIGCERHTYDHWLENYDAIGVEHEYTDDERADYGAWIKLAVARQRRIEAGQ